ncbi:MAG: tRNA (cytidine(34)-2'-O)-methyltransferase [Acidimicrobiia bacterium]|nr:tRNA (cytidine(34)-2'-O)-methyltransferase [Acidimicrobiia bacterium]
MFHVVLFRPEIPPNTGNLMRLCVNTGCRLHLIHPLGFELDDARLRRAGLDYKEYAEVEHHEDFAAYLYEAAPDRLFAYSQHGDTRYTDVELRWGDALLFGPESVGLPSEVMHHSAVTDRLRIPIAAGGRSLNLANAAAIAVYEGWRQLGFASE